MFTTYSHLVYLAASLVITIWVARTLHANSRPFLIDVFRGNTRLADSVNHLLVVGYYLMNLGLAAVAIKLGGEAGNLQQAVELVSEKIGWVLVVQGIMHAVNVFVFCEIRRRKNSEPMDIVEFL